MKQDGFIHQIVVDKDEERSLTAIVEKNSNGSVVVEHETLAAVMTGMK